MSCFDVRDRIANHQAILFRSIGKIAESLLEQTRLRLSAVALVRIIMGAVIERVDLRAVLCHVLPQPGVQLLDFRAGVATESNPALVSNNNYPPTGAI